MIMNDLCTYILQLHGQVTESEINALGPLQMTLEKARGNTTCFTICTDQSGLVGLLRHLHGLGFVFLSINRLNPDPLE